MKSVVNLLIQLQELTFIRDEQKITKNGAHSEKLDSSIKSMTKQLPADIRIMFDKLHKKDRIMITPISEGNCAICGMKLPISMVQAVRLSEKIHSCPNCARLMYFPESVPRNVGRKPRRSEPRKPGISRFSSHALVIPRLAAEDTESAIQELAYKMEEEGFVDKADKLVESALQREAILSTTVKHGIAFPHVRGVEGGGLTLALGISKKGIKFGEKDKALTKLIFFMVIPTAASAFYLKLLAGLAEALSKADARKALMTPTDPEKLWKALVKVTRTTVK